MKKAIYWCGLAAIVMTVSGGTTIGTAAQG